MDAHSTCLNPAASSPFNKRAALIVSAWFGTIFVLAAGSAFVSPPDQLPLPTLAAIALPVIGCALAYQMFPSLRRFVRKLDLRDLILLHSFRVVGVVFLVLYVYGHLPALFAWPAGVGDVMTAVFALAIGTRLYKHQVVSQRTVWWWNTFGLADLAVAVSAGVLTRSSAWAGGITSEALATFPLVLIPVFVVPLYVITHGAIYLRLWESHTPANVLKQ